MKFHSVEKLERIAINAMVGGYATVHQWSDRDPKHAGINRRLVTLNCSMDCEEPYGYEMHSRDSAKHGKRVLPLTIVIHSRCRKCAACKRRRTLFWQARAVDEWAASPMTLFGTLTLRPEVDAEVDALARISLAERGVDFDRLSTGEAFRARVRYAGLEVTRFLKRIREGDTVRGKPEIRYLLVAEAHDSARTSDAKRNRPHWHFLLHEQTSESRLVLPHEWAMKGSEPAMDRWGNPYLSPDAFLKKQWTAGHSSFAMCRSPQAAGYLCKYLTKEETNVRIRASFLYGNNHTKDPLSPPVASPTIGGNLDLPLKGVQGS